MDARTDIVGSDVEQMGADAVRAEFAEPAQLLAEAGADAILPEYVGYIEDCVAAVDACAEAGAPVFLGVRHVQPDGRMQYDESLVDLAAALKGHPVDVVLLMCTEPESVSAGLPILRDAFDGPVGVYPNIGYNPTGPIAAEPQPDREGPDFLLTSRYPPSRMADFAGVWKEMGAQIIGACCASGPEHIMAMRPVVKGAAYIYSVAVGTATTAHEIVACRLGVEDVERARLRTPPWIPDQVRRRWLTGLFCEEWNRVSCRARPPRAPTSQRPYGYSR